MEARSQRRLEIPCHNLRGNLWLSALLDDQPATDSDTDALHPSLMAAHDSISNVWDQQQAIAEPAAVAVVVESYIHLTHTFLDVCVFQMCGVSMM